MKILIVHTAFIGDIVLSTPLIERLSEKYKKAKIDYLTLPSNESILNNNPHLNEIILYDKKGKDKGIKGFLRILKILKEKKYDYAVIPHRFIKSILLCKMAKIPKTVGFSVASGAFLLDKKVKYDMTKHEVARLLDLIEVKNQSCEANPIKIYPKEENVKKIKKILLENGFDENKNNLIIIAPGSQRPEKMWLIQNYKKLIEKLVENKIENKKENFVVITGSKSEKKLDLNFSNKKNILDLRGEINLLEFSALISLSNIVVGNDSSPIHIASGFKKPFIIGIFGPGKRALGFFPWKEKSVVIEDNEFYENNIVNIPKNQHKYKKDYYKGIPKISVDRVYKEIVKRLEKI